MHPPFYIVDHRAQPETREPWEDHPQMRRGGPARLDLSQPHPGTGFATLRAPSDDPPRPRTGAGGVWPRLRAMLDRRPKTEPAR